MELNQITQKLFKKKGLLITTIVLAVITAALLIFSGFTAMSDRNKEAIAFDPINNKAGDYAYINIVALDEEWIAERGSDRFYSGLDKDNYYYILQLSNSTLRNMDKQTAYYKDTTQEMQEYRLAGTVVKISSELKEIYQEVYAIDGDQVDNYFGYYYLDTTTIPSNSSDASAYLALGCISGLITLILVLAYFSQKRSFNRCLSAISADLDTDAVANELTEMGDEYIYFGKNYLYCTLNPMAIKYSDIDWAYQHIQKSYGITVNKTIIVKSVRSGDFVIRLRDKNNLFETIFNELATRNPNILLGYSSANSKEFKERKKAK